MDTSHQSRSYRADIDGLRGLAILSVLLFHARVPGFGGGFVGVDIFFVISGLLVGAHVYGDARAGRLRLAKFYSRRAKRILPAFFVVLLFCYVTAFFLLSPLELRNFGGYGIASVFSGANLFAWRATNYFAPNASQTPLLSNWSLGVEEQFYLVFPITVILSIRASPKAFLWGTLLTMLASLALCVAASDKHLAASFYLLPFRAWEFCVGFFIALLEDHRDPKGIHQGRFSNVLPFIGMVAVLISVCFYTSGTIFPGYAVVLPVAGSAALLTFPASWISQALLSFPPLVFIGRISYSVYLWHWPLLSFAHIISDRPLPLLLSSGIAVLAIVCAVASYYLVEQPFRKSGISGRPLLLRYVAVSVLMTLLGMCFLHPSIFPARAPQVVTTDLGLSEPSLTCWGDASPDFSYQCVNPDPRPAIAIIGDSHAEVLAPQLRAMAALSGFKMYQIVKASCAPLQGVTSIHFAIAAEQQCLDYNRAALAFLKQDPQLKLVVIAANWSGPEVHGEGYVTSADLHRVPTATASARNLFFGLQEETSELKAAGKRVVIIRDVPTFRFDPVSRMRADATPLRMFFVRHLFPSMEGASTSAPLLDTFGAEDQDSARILDEVAAATGAAIFDPKPNLCSTQSCSFAVSPYPLYRDEQHITLLGAKYALRGFDLAGLLGGRQLDTASAVAAGSSLEHNWVGILTHE